MIRWVDWQHSSKISKICCIAIGSLSCRQTICASPPFEICSKKICSRFVVVANAVCPNAHANISTKIPNKNVFNSVSVAQVIQNSFPWQYCPFSLPISISIWAESALFNSRWLLLIPLMRQHMLIIFVFSNSLFILCCVWRRVDRRIQIACR